jgi:aryl-phospho-beta-D-glucosidase BglC (GH1 family)
MNEALIGSDEYYPRGGSIDDLHNVCRWATSAGMYIIIDLHGAPGVQAKDQAFTGRVSIRDMKTPLMENILLTPDFTVHNGHSVLQLHNERRARI